MLVIATPEFEQKKHQFIWKKKIDFFPVKCVLFVELEYVVFRNDNIEKKNCIIFNFIARKKIIIHVCFYIE